MDVSIERRHAFRAMDVGIEIKSTKHVLLYSIALAQPMRSCWPLDAFAVTC
jgi:hypothetical protein